ncbi:MAG TPA: helix-turn-helix domain-containing protein [Mycobacteriales bacterium]|nr:helix-turn-helix domain-containing protein [Mycobacteriales bacterium]
MELLTSQPTLPAPTGRTVAVLGTQDLSAFELGVACEVFGTDRADRGIPLWDFALCLPEPGPIRMRSGFTLDSPHGLDRVAEAALVIVPSWPHLERRPPDAVVAALRAAVDRGSWVLGFCSGTFAVAHAGLLDGRRATTHWNYAAEFRALFPAVELDRDVLYVAEGPVMTSAGTSAAIDLSLHVLRLIDGPEIANAVARRMVVPPHRDGGQAQFVERPLPVDDDHDLTDLLAWMGEHLHEDLSVARLARRARLSERTFARRFRDGTGTTPHHWLTWQRVLHAQRLLETTELDVDRVAEQSGFGSAATLRHHFVGRVGTSPQRYRRTFRRSA